MCTTADSGEIIILSDDDDKDCENDLSCLIVEVEDVKKTDCMPAPTALDEDLVVTFSRCAEVLPHARYDCPIHPFTATDCETGVPVAGNQLFCDQCFCYICDKLASSCVMWCHSEMCHCNSHKKSPFWHNLRNTALLGGLKPFNLTLSEIDSHLRCAEMMLQNFRQELSEQFSSFVKGKTLQEIGLPLLNMQGLVHECNIMRVCSSLCVRLWDDVLLVAVLKGQNVSGVRKDKGKKDILIEQISVVLLRTELLQRQCRYRELCRYLRVVQTDDSSIFQQLQDLIPFFMCMHGDFTSALTSLFPSVNAPASNLSPHSFLFYLRIFETATAPKLMVIRPAQLSCSAAKWELIESAVPLKRAELVKFALRAQRCCCAVYTDSQCWTSLLQIVNTHRGSLTALPAPSKQFLHEARDIVNSILLDRQNSSLQIPRFFLEMYPDQALLLLVTAALGLRIRDAALSPTLPVLSAFKDNVWAFTWLCDNLSSSEERLRSFIQEITREMENTAECPGRVVDILKQTHLQLSCVLKTMHRLQTHPL
uniref:B box-type domain-containing protein n=1 Tax=Amphiprion ocellaris TaxID=80972 RepID=A0AAQ6AKL8_AMPOC